MSALMIFSTLLLAEPSGPQLEVLKTFRREFVSISPGEADFPPSFWMGDPNRRNAAEMPRHEVTVDVSFEMGMYEVPQNLWEVVMGSNPSRWPGPRNSVEKVSYDEAVEFCRRVTTLLRAAQLIEMNQQVRLPSEAEWEYSARAGTTSVYSFGDDSSKLDEYGWHTGNAKGNDPPVGAKQPNPWGLYDMHGYLWEWCSDRWHPNYNGAPGVAAAWSDGGDSKRRVARGGSWKDSANFLTSSVRRAMARATRDDAVGFRCVIAREPSESE